MSEKKRSKSPAEEKAVLRRTKTSTKLSSSGGSKKDSLALSQEVVEEVSYTNSKTEEKSSRKFSTLRGFSFGKKDKEKEKDKEKDGEPEKYKTALSALFANDIPKRPNDTSKSPTTSSSSKSLPSSPDSAYSPDISKKTNGSNSVRLVRRRSNTGPDLAKAFVSQDDLEVQRAKALPPPPKPMLEGSSVLGLPAPKKIPPPPPGLPPPGHHRVSSVDLARSVTERSFSPTKKSSLPPPPPPPVRAHVDPQVVVTGHPLKQSSDSLPIKIPPPPAKTPEPPKDRPITPSGLKLPPPPPKTGDKINNIVIPPPPAKKAPPPPVKTSNDNTIGDTLPRRDRRESDAKPPPIKRANSALSIRRSVNISTDPLTLPSPKRSEANTLRHSSVTPTSTPDSTSEKSTPIRAETFTPKKTESEPATSETRERSPSSEDDEPDPVKKEKSMKRRTHIVNEIITTEITYLKTLQTVVEIYLHPLRADCSKYTVEGKSLTSEHISIIFSNIEMILGFNRQLLDELQKRQQGWNDVTLIGDVFLRLTPFLKLYTEYSNNYERSIELLKKFTKTNKHLSEFFDFRKASTNSTELLPPLDSLLITPIQRIPRYNLLLKDLMRHTSEDHPDFTNLKSALTLMEEVAEHINTSMKANDNLKKLLSIENGFVAKKGMTLSVVQPHRFLIREGPVTQIQEQKTKNAFMFLFNDCLLLARTLVMSFKQYSLKMQCPVIQTFVIDVPDGGGNQNVFKIQSPGKTITVYTRELQEKIDWMKDINETRDKQMEIEGAKMVFKLLKKEEERILLERIKSEVKDIKSALPKNPHSAEMERIMMESKKLEIIEEEKKKKEEEEKRKKEEEEKKRREEEKKKAEEDERKLQAITSSESQETVSSVGSGDTETPNNKPEEKKMKLARRATQFLSMRFRKKNTDDKDNSRLSIAVDSPISPMMTIADFRTVLQAQSLETANKEETPGEDIPKSEKRKSDELLEKESKRRSRNLNEKHHKRLSDDQIQKRLSGSKSGESEIISNEIAKEKEKEAKTNSSSENTKASSESVSEKKERKMSSENDESKPSLPTAPKPKFQPRRQTMRPTKGDELKLDNSSPKASPTSSPNTTSPIDTPLDNFEKKSVL